MTCTENEAFLVFDKLPSGTLWAVKYEVNARKYCFRTQYVKF